jgi:deoxyadenosine/deoxycytidine kinase
MDEIYQKIIALRKEKMAVAIDGYIGSGKTFIENIFTNS